MNDWLIAAGIIIIAVISGTIVGVILTKQQQKKTQKTNYQALFAMGLIFTSAGLVLTLSVENWGFFGMTALGIVFLITGLANRDKWEKEK